MADLAFEWRECRKRATGSDPNITEIIQRFSFILSDEAFYGLNRSVLVNAIFHPNEGAMKLTSHFSIGERSIWVEGIGDIAIRGGQVVSPAKSMSIGRDQRYWVVMGHDHGCMRDS